MAVAVTVKKPSNPREILTDLRPGKTRESVYPSESPAIGPMAAFLIGLGVTGLAFGAGRALNAQSSPRAEARENLKNSELLAQIFLDKEQLETLRLKNELLDASIPLSIEDQELKIRTAREFLPLDLAVRDLELDKIQAELDQATRIFPLVARQKEQAIENERTLAEARAADTAEFLATAAARAEREQLEQGLLSEQTRKLQIQTDLLAAAGDPFRPISRAAAIEALTGVAPPEFAGRRRRVITSF